MTVQALIDTMNLTVFHLEEPDRPISGGYCGDLLSWVMGKAQENDAWLTIMSNVNVAAVAALCDVACILLTEDVRPDDSGLVQYAVVMPKADFDELTEVFVIKEFEVVD